MLRWIVTRVVPVLVIGGLAGLMLLTQVLGDGGSVAELVGVVVAMIACRVWAASDVVVVTSATIYPRFTSLELSKI